MKRLFLLSKINVYFFVNLPQGDIAKKLKDYLSRETFFQFPFPGSQAPFSRDMPRVNLTVPTTTASSRTPEVERNSASPKTVSAAVTLSGMEKARGEDHQWSTRSTTPAKSDTLVIGSQDSVVDRVKSPRLWATGAESVITKEIGRVKDHRFLVEIFVRIQASACGNQYLFCVGLIQFVS